MSQAIGNLWWTHVCPPDAEIWTALQEQDPGSTNPPQMVISCYSPHEPPPPEPPSELLTGRVVAGDIEFDVDTNTWVLEDVKLEPLQEQP